jgi:hypothetical protein
LFDLLNDQEDLYEFYNCEWDSNILIRNDTLPLCNSLENISKVLAEFVNETQKESLKRFRWYCSDEKYISINFSLLVSDLKNNKNDNRLLFILNNLNLSITHFCQLSYNYIHEVGKNDQIFINEYTKRYRSYVEAAIYLNDYLENLNVLVNYVYETNEQIYTTLPKFSVMRLMMTTWNREVYNKLGKTYAEKLSNLYEVYFSRELKGMGDIGLVTDNFCDESFSFCKTPEEFRYSTESASTTMASINSCTSIYSSDSKCLSQMLEG